MCRLFTLFFFQAEDGIRDADVTGVQTCALPISSYQSEFDNAVRYTLDLRNGILRYRSPRSSQDEETSRLLHLRSNSLQEVYRLLRLDPVKDRRERVENECHRSILRLRYERDNLNVELGEVRRIPQRPFALPREP